MLSLYNPALIVNILNRDFPDVAEIISTQITETLPKARLHDISQVPSVISRLIENLEITDEAWFKSDKVRITPVPDEVKLCRITEVRELIVAVLMLLYQPERLLGLDHQRARPGLLKKIAEVIKCDRVVVSQNVSTAITRYKAYKGFKLEVEYHYGQLKAIYFDQ